NEVGLYFVWRLNAAVALYVSLRVIPPAVRSIAAQLTTPLSQLPFKPPLFYIRQRVAQRHDIERSRVAADTRDDVRRIVAVKQRPADLDHRIPSLVLGQEGN